MISIAQRTLPRAVLGATLAAFCVAAAAQSADAIHHGIHPANGGSTADTFYSLFAVNCGTPTLDPEHPPRIVRTPADAGANDVVEAISIEYFVVGPATVVCPAVMAPDTLIPIRIGHLLEGATIITHSLSEADADSAAARSSAKRSWVHRVEVGDTPNAAVSGTWFDPAAAGVGVSLSLAPDPGEVEPTAVLFLATLTPDGEPTWLTGSGKFVDATLRVTLTRSSAASAAGTIETVPVGTATFEYQGCGEARLAVDGIGVRFPATQAQLHQLTHTFGLPSCTPPTTRVSGR